jgi:hypothetical protein
MSGKVSQVQHQLSKQSQQFKQMSAELLDETYHPDGQGRRCALALGDRRQRPLLPAAKGGFVFRLEQKSVRQAMAPRLPQKEGTCAIESSHPAQIPDFINVSDGLCLQGVPRSGRKLGDTAKVPMPEYLQAPRLNLKLGRLQVVGGNRHLELVEVRFLL